MKQLELKSITAKLPKTAAVYGILIIAIVFSIWTPGFFSFSNLYNNMRQIAPLAIITICSFLAILTHHIDLSVGGMMGLAGIVGCMLTNAGWDILPACLVAVLSTMAIGLLNGIIIAFTNIAPFIVTLATMGISQSLAQVLGRQSLKITNEAFGLLDTANVFGFLPLPILITAILYLVFGFLLVRRPYGTHLYAVGGREDAALASGINVKRIKISVFTINGLLAGLAGLLFSARILAANPTFGEGYELQGICAAVLGGAALTGGKGTIGGAFLGALAIQLLRNGMNYAGVNSSSQMIAVGVLLVIIITVDSMRKGAR